MLIGINAMAIVLFVLAKLYYVTKNKIRDKKWNAMTHEVYLSLNDEDWMMILTMIQEQIDYKRNTTDTASGRLDFRFAS